MRVEFNVDEVVRRLQGLRVEGIPGAIRRAMTRSLKSGSVAMAREIASDAALKVGTVKDQLRTEVVGGQGDTGLVGRISISGKRIPLVQFSAKGPGGATATQFVPSRGKGRGVTANTGGGRKVYPSTFMAVVGNGHIGVFQRKAHGRLPIEEKFGPSLPHVFMKKTTTAITRFQEQFPKELQSEVSVAIKKAASS